MPLSLNLLTTDIYRGKSAYSNWIIRENICQACKLDVVLYAEIAPLMLMTYYWKFVGDKILLKKWNLWILVLQQNWIDIYIYWNIQSWIKSVFAFRMLVGCDSVIQILHHHLTILNAADHKFLNLHFLISFRFTRIG